MATRFFTLFIVTYSYIFFSKNSRVSYGTPSQLLECSPTSALLQSISSVLCLTPGYSSAPDHSTSELLRTL